MTEPVRKDDTLDARVPPATARVAHEAAGHARSVAWRDALLRPRERLPR